MKKRSKIILRDRPGVVWLLGLAVLGLAAAYVLVTTIHRSEKVAHVYVAAHTIQANTPITREDITTENVSASVVPTGVVQNSQAIIGKYADATIIKGSPILRLDVAPASTVRELIRTYGMNFVGATVQLDPSDVPVSDVNPGDIVDLIGVYGTQNQQVYTQWIATGVPVLAVDTTNTKIVLAIPKNDAPDLVRDLTTGKVRVMLDPNPFHGSINFNANTTNPQSTLSSSSNSSGSTSQSKGK